MSAAVTPIDTKSPKGGGIGAAARLDIVEEMNRDHAVLLLGDRPVVLKEGTGADGRDEIRLLALAGFHEWMRPHFVWVPSEDGPARKLQKSKAWTDSAARRQYDGLVFDPSSSSPASYYNLWKGFAVQPAAPGAPVSCSKFLLHVADNVCSGDEKLYQWVMGWFASMFQHPTQKLGTSLVLRGAQGSGKTIVGTVMGSLLGTHYTLIADQQRLVGRFNSHLANCLLLQLDEATWGGNHEAAGKLKDLVTGHWQFIEYKGREPVKVRNYVRLLITGNNPWLVPAGVEERRFCVIDVGDGERQNAGYFQAIQEEMDSGGREALLRYLLTMDLSGIPLRTIPNTAALAEQKIASLAPEQHWWLDILHAGSLPGDVLGEGRCLTTALFDHYVAKTQKVGITRKQMETQLGSTLKRLVPGLRRERHAVLTGGTMKRPYFYEFPPLAACRQEFDRLVGGMGWGEPSEWQGGPDL